MKNTSPSPLLTQQALLQTVKTQLKKEFVGIDAIIDQIVDSLSSWYLFPHIQERPVIVDLWGLTGVGKSSLIFRLTELLDLQHKYYHFDLGDNSTSDYSIKKQLEDIYRNDNGFPIIIGMDEFQHARTINEDSKEVNHPATRLVWQLIDSGKFQVNTYDHNMENLYGLFTRLNHLHKKQVGVENGMVVSNKDEYRKYSSTQSYSNMLKGKTDKTEKPIYFIPETYYDDILEVAKPRFQSVFDVKDYALSLNGDETIAWLYNLVERGLGPKTVDCSKALVFILGNLDEAYQMSGEFNPDMEADQFHEQSLKITVPIIKNALKQRFRSEQIARLGNTHIIYPAFNKASFEKIILLELVKIQNLIKEKEDTHLYFDASIIDLIYKEGVYPTQGTRPVYTTIQQLIKTQLGKILTERTKPWLSHSEILVTYCDDHLLVEYILQDIALHSLQIPLELNLDKLRVETKDDVQAMVAVHEAGHAVVSAILLKVLPDAVYSITADANAGGFAAIQMPWTYLSKNQILNTLALHMGGHAAEKIVFGEEHVTSGACGDLSEATKLIAHALKESGMGTLKGTINMNGLLTGYFLKDVQDQLNTEMLEWLNNAYALAEKTLCEQEVLLLHIANYLSDHRKLDKPLLREMIKEFAINFSPFKSLSSNGPIKNIPTKPTEATGEIRSHAITS